MATSTGIRPRRLWQGSWQPGSRKDQNRGTKRDVSRPVPLDVRTSVGRSPVLVPSPTTRKRCQLVVAGFFLRRSRLFSRRVRLPSRRALRRSRLLSRRAVRRARPPSRCSASCCRSAPLGAAAGAAVCASASDPVSTVGTASAIPRNERKLRREFTSALSLISHSSLKIAPSWSAGLFRPR